jgi:manganese oxidase
LHVSGHWFRFEPHSATSPPINTVHLGISERADLVIPQAGGPQQLPGDYLYQNGRASKLLEGSWGLIRVHDGKTDSDLEKLPGRETIPIPKPTLCPEDSPKKHFEVLALEAALPMLNNDMGKIFVLAKDKAALLAGATRPEPLVLHVNVEDCITMVLSNETSVELGLFIDGLAYDPQTSGLQVGRNKGQLTPAGETQTYTYYASSELGETVALIRDGADPLNSPRLGLYGAIVVGEKGTTYSHPVSGEDMALKASWRVDAQPPNGPSYRDFSLFIQDEDQVIGTAVMPYTEQVEGVLGLNYQLEPLAKRLAQSGDSSAVFRSDSHGDPSTPLLEAYSGDNVRIHVLLPYSEQAHVFSLENHAWPLEPGRRSSLLSSVQLGALEAVTLRPQGGAGPAGDYLYGDHREPYREAGLWGLMRVYASDKANLLPLPAP